MFPRSSPPIASWVGKHSVDDTVGCVTRALDYNFRSTRQLIPSITHHVQTVEPGRVYEVTPQLMPGMEFYFVRVRSEGPEQTTIELYIPPMQYNAQLRDLLAKCA
jgi:hypothetical protein